MQRQSGLSWRSVRAAWLSPSVRRHGHRAKTGWCARMRRCDDALVTESSLPSGRTGPRAWPAARRPTIAGLGMTALGKVYGPTPGQFAAEAVRLAVADAGLRLTDVDGLLTSSGVTGGISIDLQRDLG